MRVPQYYFNFKCIADKCRHSCCVGWEIDVDERTLARYRALGGEMGETIIESIEETEDGVHFRLCTDERCPHLDEKGLSYELVAEFSYVLLLSRDNPIAAKETITYEDLSDYIEIAHADPYVPTLSMSKVFREELPDKVNRRIFVFERASQLDLISENPKTYMWVSPVSDQILNRYDLVQRVCEGNKKQYKDVLIYHKGYKLSKLDREFITALYESKRKYVK